MTEFLARFGDAFWDLDTQAMLISCDWLVDHDQEDLADDLRLVLNGPNPAGDTRALCSQGIYLNPRWKVFYLGKRFNAGDTRFGKIWFTYKRGINQTECWFHGGRIYFENPISGRRDMGSRPEDDIGPATVLSHLYSQEAIACSRRFLLGHEQVPNRDVLLGLACLASCQS